MKRRSASHKGGGAPTAIEVLLPTPTVFGNTNRKGATANSGDGIATALYDRLLPTPMARPGKGDALNGGSNGRKALLPTPVASAATRGHVQVKPRNGRDLMALLPTPLARDVKSDRARHETLSKNSRPLSEQSGMLGLLGTVDSPVWQRRALLLGLIEWMMGFPPGWLCGRATSALQPTATPSSRKSRARSLPR